MNDEKFIKLFIMYFYIILKIFCLAPFTIDFKTLKVQNSSFSAFVYILIVSISLYFDEPLERKIYEDHDTYFQSKLVKLFNSLLTIKSYMVVATSVLLIIFKKPKLRKAFQDLMEVISFLKWETLAFTLRQNAKKFIKIQLFFVLYFLIGRYLYYLAPNKNPRWLIILVLLPLSQYRYFIVIVLVAQKQFIFSFFECCFKALNICFKAQIKSCNSASELCALVDKTAKIHFRLLEVAFYLHKNFSVIIVMICLDTSINFVLEAFIVYLSSMLFYRDDLNDHRIYSFVFENVLTASYGIVRLGQFVVILYAGRSTTKEVKSDIFFCNLLKVH